MVASGKARPTWLNYIGETMKKALYCIADRFMWLFEKYEFRITDSRCFPNFGGVGSVQLANPSMKVCFVVEAGDPVCLLFAPQNGWEDRDGVSVDIVYRRLTGKLDDEAFVTDATVAFLEKNFDAIQSLFADNDPGELRKDLKALEEDRANRLFGEL